MKFERDCAIIGTIEINAAYEWKRDHKDPVIAFSISTPRNEKSGYRTCFIINGVNYAISYATWHTGMRHPSPTYVTIKRVHLIDGTGYVNSWDDPEPTSKALRLIYEALSSLFATLSKDENLHAQLRAEARERALSALEAAHNAALRSVETTLQEWENFKANPNLYMGKRDDR